MPPNLKESDIQKSILDYLLLRGHIPVRFNNLPTWKKDGVFIPVRRKGIADILVCTKVGQFAAIEVKRPGGKTSPDQDEFLADIRSKGATGIVATSIEDVQAAGL